MDLGVSDARASRPNFDRALGAIHDGDTLVITTLDRLGRSTQNMLTFVDELRGREAGLRVLNLGGGDVDTSTPMGSMLFTIMAALAQMELEIKRERIADSLSKRRAAGGDLGGVRRRSLIGRSAMLFSSLVVVKRPRRCFVIWRCPVPRSTAGCELSCLDLCAGALRSPPRSCVGGSSGGGVPSHHGGNRINEDR
jgi:hypothetical protein